MRVLLATLAALAVSLPTTLPAAPAGAQEPGGVIAYVRDADGPAGPAEPTILVARADGTGERVYATGRGPSLAPGDTSVAYAARAGGAWQLVVGRLDDAFSVRQVTTLPDRDAEFGAGRFGVVDSVWSPGRTWLAVRLMEGSTTTVGFVRPDGGELRRMAFGHLYGSTIAWRDDTQVAIRNEEGLRLVTVTGAATVPAGAGQTDTPAAWLDADRLVVTTADGVDVLDVTTGKRATVLRGATAWATTPAGEILFTTTDAIGAVTDAGDVVWREPVPAGWQVLNVVGHRAQPLVEAVDATGTIRIHVVEPATGVGAGVGASGPLRPAALRELAEGSDVTVSDAAALDDVVPPASPGATPPATTPPGTAPPGTDPPGPAPGGSPVAAPGPVDPPPGRSAFAAAVPAAHEVGTQVSALLTNALFALLLMLLITFPAELFNSTLEEHYDEVRGWFRLKPRAEPAPRSRARRVVAFTAYTAAAALLYGLLDPSFGPDATSARLYLGLLAGLVVVTLVFAAAPLAYARRRYGERGLLRVLPGTLLVGAVCVLVSRLARFEPGYLYGIVGGFVFARRFSREEEGRNAFAGALAAFAVALVAWLAWQPVDAAAADGSPGLLLGLADSTLAAIAVGGLQGLVIGLVPVRSLPGYALARWRRPVWGAAYTVVLFVFLHLLLHPGSGVGPDARPVPFYTWLGLFAGFGVVSVAFWGYFRLRPASSG